MALASLTRPLVLASQTRAFLPLWARSTPAYTPSRLASTTADTDSAANSEKDSQPKTYRGPEGELLTRLPLVKYVLFVCNSSFVKHTQSTDTSILC
jgi:hypothetical protein